MDCSHC